METETVKPRDWITPAEVAARCAVGYRAVMCWIVDGRLVNGKTIKLKAGRMVGRYRIKPADLTEFLELCNGQS